MIGEQVGNYRIHDRVGKGGMGSVFLAEHVTLGRKAALKLLHPEFADSPELAQRFVVEARACAAVRHPNIVEILV